jgi:hypothetical protein
MITDDEAHGWCRAPAPWRRGRDVFDDYDAERVLTELVGLGPRSRVRRAAATGSHGGLAYRTHTAVVAPSRTRPMPARPRLTLIRGGA